MFLTGFISLSVLLLIPLSITFFVFMNNSDAISFNIDQVCLINPFPVFAFGDFNVHHDDWLTYSGGTERPGELCYNFLSQMTLLRWLTFLLRPLTVTLTVLLFWIYLFLLMLVFFLHWLSLHWEIVIMWLSQFPSTSCQTQNEMHCFIT